MPNGRLVKVINGIQWEPSELVTELRSASWSAVARRRCRHSRRPNGASSSGCARRSPCSAILNALAYNTEPPPGRATLRSFRGVVRHRTAHCLEAALVRGRHPRTARLPPARPELRVDRPARSRDLRLSPERPMGIRRAIARSRAARAQGRLRHATRAGAELRRSVRRLHRPRDRLRGGGPAHAGRLRLEVVRRATSGRSSACCSTIRTDRSAAPTSTSIGCGAGTSSTVSGSAGSRSTTAGRTGGRRCRTAILKAEVLNAEVGTC